MASPQEKAMQGMQEHLLKFHEASGGDIMAVTGLFQAMSGQPMPPPIICQIVGLPPDTQIVPVDNLLTGMMGVLDDNDTAEMYIPIIEKQTVEVQEKFQARNLRKDVTFDEALGLDLEQRLLASMQGDEPLLSHVKNIRGVHEAWKEHVKDEFDASKYPSVVAGPQVLIFEPMLMSSYATVLTPAEKERFFFKPDEETGDFVLEKLAPLHLSSAAVSAAQRKRILWLASEITGETIDLESVSDEAFSKLNAAIAEALSTSEFTANIDRILGDVNLGTSQERIKVVEGEMQGTMAGQAEKVGAKGYRGLVVYACFKAVCDENYPNSTPNDPKGADKESRAAIRAVRRKIGDRFYRKKWLPLESNPEVFSQLGYQLGLPKTYEFFEIFGFDPELLQMVPGPVHAVLVCFPLTDSYKESVLSSTPQESPEGGPYFMRQSIPNACGTVGLVHAFANLSSPQSEGWLGTFVANTSGQSPLERAGALETDEGLAIVHNDSAMQGDTNVAQFQGAQGGGAYTDILHFVCYVHHQGGLFELDGLKQGPKRHQDTSPEKLLEDVVKVVQASMPEGDLRINLMALSTKP